MRTVQVFHYVETSGGNSATPRSQLKWDRQEKYQGKFQQWGLDFEELQDGVGHYTAAVVEMDDGSIELVPTNLIQFID